MAQSSDILQASINYVTAWNALKEYKGLERLRMEADSPLERFQMVVAAENLEELATCTMALAERLKAGETYWPELVAWAGRARVLFEDSLNVLEKLEGEPAWAELFRRLHRLSIKICKLGKRRSGGKGK